LAARLSELEPPDAGAVVEEVVVVGVVVAVVGATVAVVAELEEEPELPQPARASSPVASRGRRALGIGCFSARVELGLTVGSSVGSGS
jgi:hypothetical protein